MDFRTFAAVATFALPILTYLLGYLLGYYRGRFCEIYSNNPTEDVFVSQLVETLQEEISWLRQEFDLNCAMGRLNLRATLDRERDWFLKSFEKSSVREAIDEGGGDIDRRE